jgi:hypothetical protein
VDVREAYQKLFDSAAAMKSDYSVINEKLYLCRKVVFYVLLTLSKYLVIFSFVL